MSRDTIRNEIAREAFPLIMREYLKRNGFGDTAAMNCAVHARKFADALLVELERNKA